jgi:hypothetical protein
MRSDRFVAIAMCKMTLFQMDMCRDRLNLPRERKKMEQGGMKCNKEDGMKEVREAKN